MTVQPRVTPQALSSRNAAAPPQVFWQHPAPGSLQRKSANVQRQGAPAEARLAPRREPAPPPVSWPGRVWGPGGRRRESRRDRRRSEVTRAGSGEPDGPPAVPRSGGAAAAPRSQGQTIQRAAESKSEDRDVIREFNDLMLMGPKANFMGSFKVEVPRKTGELVALSGVHGPGGAFLTASGKPSKAEMKMVDVYTAASGRRRRAASCATTRRRRSGSESGGKHRRDASGLDTQAQHVVPFSEPRETAGTSRHRSESSPPPTPC